MTEPSGDRLKTRRTDDDGSSPRRGVGFQPAGRVIRRGWLKWARLCYVVPGSDKPGGLSSRDGSNAIDGLGNARTIKPKDCRPPGRGDLNERAERRQVENPSYDRGRGVMFDRSCRSDSTGSGIVPLTPPAWPGRAAAFRASWEHSSSGGAPRSIAREPGG